MPTPDDITGAVTAARPSSAAKKLRDEVAAASAPETAAATTPTAPSGEPLKVYRGKRGVETSRRSREIILGEAASMVPVEDDAAVGGGCHTADEVAKMIKREESVDLVKRAEATSWEPEYEAQGVLPTAVTNKSRYAMENEEKKTGRSASTTVTTRNTSVSLNLILMDQPMLRKTKLICTMGPKCWSEEGLGKLLDAGLGVARFNFSHGEHAAHQEVLDRFRKVVAERKASGGKGAWAATLLDTKGPEVRTAMLKDGKDIELEAGQDIIVFAAGDEYTTFEGYKNETETKIGCSYAKLCQSVKPGNRLLFADGSIVIEVVEILDEKNLKGKVLNSKKLGQRKNGNLPGVKVDLPVLSEKDINDVQNFCAKNKMDYIAVSFVQTGDDIKLVRKTLDDAGGHETQIIAKIENQAGMENFDDILKETDGIMVARGDLGMEIPSEKVSLAQKMLITKTNLAGKFVICATQMLESMIGNPLPTRAEMTDVANAVFDGADATMLSGETANGAFPAEACKTMADIAKNAELGIDYWHQFDMLRTGISAKGVVPPVEATLAMVSRASVCFSADKDGDGVIDSNEGCMVIVISKTGEGARLVSKYRPACPIIVATSSESVARHTNTSFGQWPFLITCELDLQGILQGAIDKYSGLGTGIGWPMASKKLIVATGADTLECDINPVVKIMAIGTDGKLVTTPAYEHKPTDYVIPTGLNGTVTSRVTKISMGHVLTPAKIYPKTKVFCTMGPKCWSEEGLGKLLDAGLGVARFNFSHGEHAAHQEVLDRFRKVVADKAAAQKDLYGAASPTWACLLDTKGPEVRTAMLKDGKDIELEAGQDIIVFAAGDEYTTFEGYKNETETKIGCSYAKLCQSVKPGNRLLFADGSIVIEVVEILDEKNLKGKVLNSKKLGQRKNGNLPGVKVDLPVLSEKDINDVQNFCAKNKMDYIAVSFVQTGDDIKLVRKTLDDAAGGGGTDVKIIAKIENQAGLENFDDILKETDGIMVARGDLGMEIPAEKVPLAQKMMITKCQLAGKLVVCATQMLESMIGNPLPTRAEMTDVANAVFDGADATMLSGETANGAFPAEAVQNMRAIASNAETSTSYYSLYKYIRNYTPKPMTALEAVASSAIKSAIDMGASVIIVFTNLMLPAQLLAKYRPPVPIVVATSNPRLAPQLNAVYGCVPLLYDKIDDCEMLLPEMYKTIQALGIASLKPGDDESDQVIVVRGRDVKGAVNEAHDVHNMVFTTVVLGDEASSLIKPAAYSGTHTLTCTSTKVGLDLVCEPVTTPRKTKLICTMGPKCWSEEGLGKLLDAGLGVARFNFSHGEHAAHQEVLDRFRKVVAERKASGGKGAWAATLLDTKGPEVRTAMLKDGKDIELEAGQDIIVFAAGDEYTTFEGYKNETETKIGCSYAKLCQSVKPGNRLLFADGSIVIEVVEILDEKNLKGKVLNSKKLGQRKNGNLPGVKVDLPVLSEKDINDVQNFCAKNKMDYIAVSFVQTGDDIKLVRKTLDDAGGHDTQIIAKIENQAGMENFDDILKETDGIMVARGDLGMEIPPAKVALAQKMMITKCQIAGKFVICATQMLESMIGNPLPTRAEMTDVANAVFDGADATMLSGETANGAFPSEAVQTMADVTQNAEVGVNRYQLFDFVRDLTPKPMGTIEAVVSCAAKNAVDTSAALIIVFSESGSAACLTAKYRPSVPVLVLSTNPSVLRHTNTTFALYPYLLKELTTPETFESVISDALKYAVEANLCPLGKEVIVISGSKKPDADSAPKLSFAIAPGTIKPFVSTRSSAKVTTYRATSIALTQVFSDEAPVRKTKILCTMGPKCWSEEGLGKLLDAGMSIARFNFSHGEHAAHQEVLDRFRKVVAERKASGGKGAWAATLLDTKGPEVRTAMLKDGKDIELEAGQDIIVFAAGDEYTTFEGYKNETETKIGCSYAKLCQSVKPGNRLLFADGSIVIEVVEILDEKNLKGKVLNSKKLGQRKNGNLPGVKVDIPVLTEKDINDVQNFCAKNKMDYIAVSFVQTGDDIKLVRKTLDDAGGHDTQIIAKIENEAGLENYDAILKETDGIMVARGDLGMEIPSSKVALAQKMLITKAQVAGKFVICATQMLESMIGNPLPTRAEMTDVANAVFDGADATMLSGETANGSFPAEAVQTMASISSNAELCNNFNAVGAYIRDHTVRPFANAEALGVAAVAAVNNSDAQIIIVESDNGAKARFVSKYRPACPILVVTTRESTAAHTGAHFAQHPMKVESLAGVLPAYKEYAVKEGLCEADAVVVFLRKDGSILVK